MKELDYKTTIIIPAAGAGRRMKSYGPKPLIKVGDSTVIKNQISLLKTYIPDSRIVLVCGFKAERLMNETPPFILKILNERYHKTTVVISIGMGLRVSGLSKKIIVVSGDLVFNSDAIKNLPDFSSIVVTDRGMGDDEVGCVIDSDGELTHLMYDLPRKWGQIAIIMGKELDMFKKLCWDEKNSGKFGFEVINQIMEAGGTFQCISGEEIKIVDIDNSKDIQKAKEILL